MPKHLQHRTERAYQMIGGLTPIPADCGELCGAACCRGDEYGMLLFPGEAYRLSLVPGFRTERIKYMDGHAWLLSCPGHCDRELRPLACRIFPLAPHVDEAGKVKALPDPRAHRMCPLATGEHLDPRFVKSVDKALAYLAREPRILGFMKSLSLELDELRRFTQPR